MHELRSASTAFALAMLAAISARAEEPVEDEQAEAPVAVAGETIYVEDRAPEEAGTATSRRVSSAAVQAAPRLSGEDLLELVPGLYMNRHGAEGKGQQFFLRGFDAVHGSDIEVSVAGIPINEPSNVHGQGYVDLGFVIPEVVLTLTGNKGSFRLDQGDFATAGSVAFTLGVPRSQRGTSISYEVGSTNRHRLLVLHAPPAEPERSFAALELMHDDGFGTNRQSGRVTALVRRRVWEQRSRRAGRRLDLTAAAYSARFGEPGTLPLADFQRGTMGFYDSWVKTGEGRSQRVIVGAELDDQRLAGRLGALLHAQWRFLELDENFTGFLLHPELGDRRLQVHESLNVGARVVWERSLGERFTLVVGGDGLVDAVSQREDQIRADGSAWSWNRDLEALQLFGDLRAGARAHLGSRVRVEAGARLDGVFIDARDRLADGPGASRGMATVSPRIASSFLPASALELYAAYGRGLRPPEARAISAPSIPEEDVDQSQYEGGAPRVTRSDAAELGARVRSGGLDLGVAAFGVWIGNEMLFDHVSGTNVELNATRRFGLEAFVEYRACWFGLRADLTAVDAHFVESGNPVPNAPTLLARGELRLGRDRGLSGSALLTHVGSRPLAHGATAGASTLLELGGGYRWDDLALDLRVDNALGARWHAGEYHFASWFDRSLPPSHLPRIHFAAGRPFGVRLTLTRWF